MFRRIAAFARSLFTNTNDRRKALERKVAPSKKTRYTTSTQKANHEQPTVSTITDDHALQSRTRFNGRRSTGSTARNAFSGNVPATYAHLLDRMQDRNDKYHANPGRFPKTSYEHEHVRLNEKAIANYDKTYRHIDERDATGPLEDRVDADSRADNHSVSNLDTMIAKGALDRAYRSGLDHTESRGYLKRMLIHNGVFPTEVMLDAHVEQYLQQQSSDQARDREEQSSEEYRRES